MEPIINPWIIYGIDLIHNLCTVSILAIIASSIGMFAIVGGDSSCMDEQDTKILKTLFVVFVVATVLLVILPSRDTMLTMLALQYVTPDNVQAIQGNVADFVNQIVQAVKEAR